MRTLFFFVLAIAAIGTSLSCQRAKPISSSKEDRPPTVELDRIAGQVQGSGTTQCQTFLFHVVGKPDLPLLLDMQGTGLYTQSQGEFSVPGRRLSNAGKMNVLVIDKPGISYDSKFVSDSTYDQFALDVEKFSKYTIDDLAACGVHALQWAIESQKAVNPAKIFLQGHSEGAIMMALVLESLIAKNSELAKRVDSLILTGTPLDPFKEVLFGQLRRNYQSGLKEMLIAHVEKAVVVGDDAFLIDRFKVSSSYLKTAFSKPALSETLLSLATKRKGTKFFFFHGLEDGNVPVASVKAFEKQIQDPARAGNPSFDATFNYYKDAGHGLSMEAMDDIVKAIESRF